MLGLAPFTLPNPITPSNASSVLQNLFGSIEHPEKTVSTASLTRPNETEGFFTLGSIDGSGLIGNSTITYTPILKSRFTGKLHLDFYIHQ